MIPISNDNSLNILKHVAKEVHKKLKGAPNMINRVKEYKCWFSSANKNLNCNKNRNT